MARAARYILSAAIAGTFAVTATIPASAQFYKGKTLSVIINYGPGGNTDIQGRALLRFMNDHIPGKPRTVVKNMPGAGGIVGTNYLVEAAKRDGSVMGIFTIAIMGELLADPALRVSHKDLVYIGAIGQQQIAHVRKDVKPGVTGWKDFLKVTEVFKSAGHAPTSSKDISIKLTLGLLGIKYKHVTGFKSAGPIRRALLQNEVQYTEDSLTGFYAAVYPTLIKPGISVPLWHTGVPTKDGGLRHAPTVDKSIPTFLEVYKARHGANAKPSGHAWQIYRKLAQTRQFLRILILPPGAPKAATAALREAWKKTTTDKGYLAEYKKQNNSELEPLIGEEAQEVISDVLTISPDLRKFLQTLAKG
jgi:tripartite-type tricarboxylate transporter receptor subunit TctC